MDTMNPEKRGLYFEEFHIGQKIYTTTRTVTETDIVNFAGLSGDYNQIHTSEDYSKSTPYGKRIAHGLLVLSIVSGLAVQTGFLENTVINLREVSDWKFVKPVFIGDTIGVEMEVMETKALPRIKGGSLDIHFEVKNQEKETVGRGAWKVLVASRPE
jgi:acyl dehydratase